MIEVIVSLAADDSVKATRVTVHQLPIDELVMVSTVEQVSLLIW